MAEAGYDLDKRPSMPWEVLIDFSRGLTIFSQVGSGFSQWIRSKGTNVITFR